MFGCVGYWLFIVIYLLFVWFSEGDMFYSSVACVVFCYMILLCVCV